MSFKPIPLNLPPYPFKMKEEAGSLFIFDDIRKKYLVLTPEEWVRQHVVKFLIHERNFPRSLIKLEGGLKLNALQKRTDILIFDSAGNRILLVECKAPSVKITQNAFDQIARYNFIHRTSFLIVSNGIQHYCCQVDFEQKTYRFIPEIPDFNTFR
jgi:hypothetical protein